MDWFGGRVNLGNLDLAGAVNKLQESVKNIEKNFDNALGLEDSSQSTNEESGQRTSTSGKALFGPVMAFMGQKGEESEDDKQENETPHDEEGRKSTDDLPEKSETVEVSSLVEGKQDEAANEEVNVAEKISPSEGDKELEEQKDLVDSGTVEEASTVTEASGEAKSDAHEPDVSPESTSQEVVMTRSTEESSNEVHADIGSSEMESSETKVLADHTDEEHSPKVITREGSEVVEAVESTQEPTVGSPTSVEGSTDGKAENPIEDSATSGAMTVAESGSPTESQNNALLTEHSVDGAREIVSDEASHGNNENIDTVEESKSSSKSGTHGKDDGVSPTSNVSDSAHAAFELDKIKKEMKMMEAALQGAARQAQTKADEIARLMHENEQMKSIVEELRRKSNDAEIESLREEYHQRVSTLERKVYALTKERYTLRREQNKRSDTAALLKEKDEIITQVMAEGEEL